MVLNRWSDEIDSPQNDPIFVYEGNSSEEIWTMKDGTQIRVGDMADSHLQNCYKMVLNNRNLFWIKVFKAETEKRVDKTLANMPTIERIDFGTALDTPPTEIAKIVKEMQDAISAEYQKQLLAEESTLEEVLRENGWCKASDLIDDFEIAIQKLKMPTLVRWNLEDLFIEFRKKYSGGIT